MNNKRGEPRPSCGPWRRWLPLLVILASGPAGASDRSFEELQRSEDPALLMEWGKRYFYGVKAPQSMDHALQLYCAAARLGSGEAQYRLGDIYARTLAGKRDEVLAAAWLLKATISKHDSAKARLAQWDLTDVALPAEPECVLSGQMVARTVPRVRRVADAPPQPESKPKPDTVPPTLRDSPMRGEIERLVRDLAPGYGLNPAVVLAVVEVESKFNPKAESPKHAQGLMQLIPATAKRFGVVDPWDPHQNLHGGMAYLRWLLNHFDGDLRLALAGYNAGEQAVTRHGGVPPYTETQNYVRRVARVLGVAEDALGSVETRSAVFTAPRKTKAAAKGDWESRFFTVDSSG